MPNTQTYGLGRMYEILRELGGEKGIRVVAASMKRLLGCRPNAEPTYARAVAVPRCLLFGSTRAAKLR